VGVRLLRDIEQAVTKAFDTDELAPYRNSADTINAQLRQRLASAIREFESEVATIIRIEGEQAENARNSRRQQRYLRIAASGLLLGLLYLLASIPLRYAGISIWAPPITTTSNVALAELGALVFTVIVQAAPGPITRILPTATQASDLAAGLDQAKTRYEPRLEQFTLEQIRLIIPELPEEHLKSAFVDYSSDLVELALSDPFSTQALTTVERFVKGYKASALGLAGPRGAGKTTILRFLTTMPGTLGVYIPAPVRYEPNELLARVFEDLANTFLEERRKRTSYETLSRTLARWLRRSPLIILAVYATVGLLIGAVALYTVDPAIILNTARWISILIVLAVLALVGLPLRHYLADQRKHRQRDQQESPVDQAAAVLRNLRWQRQQTSTLSLKAEPWGGLLKFGSDRAATAVERDIGRARLVADFQEFVRKINQTHGWDRIVIAIDELDKLASADDLIAVINEIKDILHIEGTHVIVSVSHEALFRFLLRGLPSRDVFDSAFDQILEIPSLSESEAIEVLRKRAIGFPEAWAVICHILSNGLPRDLLRYGRRCIDIYRRVGGGINDVPVRLVGELAAEKAQAELRASGTDERLTVRGKSQLQTAVQLAKEGSISELNRLLDEIYGESQSHLTEWLAWLSDVMHSVAADTANGGLESVALLAQRAALQPQGDTWTASG